MKKHMIVGIAVAMGMFSVGAISASAASLHCIDGKFPEKQAFQKFTQETAGITGTLKTKDIELRQLYSYDGFDSRKADELESGIKELKGKIKLAAEKYGIPSCCIG